MESFSHVPPGFRFHPTDEELVDYYLRNKVSSRRIDLDVIKDVDLYKIEPWDLQEICRIGTEEEESEWYFFSHKDKKYPTGTRTNRATSAGFWKATGRDKAIYSKKKEVIGMRKTLVFYKGRAPNGQKSDWIMHEYRLETDEENGTPQEEGWVVCRVFKKRVTSTTMSKQVFMREHESPLDPPPSPSWYPFLHSADFDHHHHIPTAHHFLQLPLLHTPKLLLHSPPPSTHDNNPIIMAEPPYGGIQEDHQQQGVFQQIGVFDQVTTDWRVLDKFVASQLSQDNNNNNNNKDNASNNKDNSYSSRGAAIISNEQFITDMDKQDILILPGNEVASSSNSTCPIDLWK